MADGTLGRPRHAPRKIQKNAVGATITMGRSKGRSKHAKASRGRNMPPLDATPERLAKSDHSEIINPALIDSSEQPIGRVRRFRDSWIDRMYRREQLTYAQWFTCGWYRDLHAAAFTAQRVVADYGQGAGGAGSGSYGQAFTEAQQRKRILLRQVRTQVPASMLRLFEALVVHDEVPAFSNGQQRARFAARIADAVQPLAEYMMAPGHWLTGTADDDRVAQVKAV